MTPARMAWLFLLLAAGGVQAGDDLAGEWAYQALNAGDSNFRAEQDGTRVTFYRVLHPEFEGERYRLEHLYRGQVHGSAISGKLYVREDGRGDFEPLRAFQGRVLGADRLELDDMPLRRVTAERVAPARTQPPPPPPPPAPEDTAAGAVDDGAAAGGRYQRVVIKRRPRPAAPPAGDTGRQSPPAAKPVAEAPAPLVIPELVRVARQVSARSTRAQQAIAAGDRAFAGKDYAAAAAHYRRARAADPAKVEVLYKLGWSHGSLGVEAERNGDPGAAAEHYRRAIEFWTRALRYDPYNRGARENIRRARAKLAKLQNP